MTSEAPPPRPEAPDERDCCGSGCPNCILTVHEEAMERWRQDMRAWQQRQNSTPAA